MARTRGQRARITPMDRVARYGEAGKPALTRAVRRLAMTSGRKATYEVLRDIEAIAAVWAEHLRDDAGTL